MKRIPPADEFQEAVLISACLLDGNPALSIVKSAGVMASDFFNDGHRILFRGIEALDGEAKPYDVTSLYGWIRQQGFDQRVQSSFLGDIVGKTPTVSNLLHSAKVVRKLGALREVIARMQLGVAEGYGPPKDLRPWFERLVADLDEILLAAYPNQNSTHVSRIVGEVMNNLHNPPTAVARTHIESLDRKLGPLHVGYNLVIAARPGMGKTALAIQIALEEADRAHGVVINSVEQPREEIVKRLIYNRARLDGTLFRNYALPKKAQHGLPLPTLEHWNAATTAGTEIEALPIRVIDDCADVAKWRMRTLKEARDLEKEGYHVTLVITDYLQLMESSNAGNREQAIADVSRRSKALAKELGCAHIAISQLNRGVESRDDKRPMLSDLRESGSIEQDADSVVFVYRDSYYRGNDDKDTELLVAKNRHGSLGVARADFDQETGRFTSKNIA